MCKSIYIQYVRVKWGNDNVIIWILTRKKGQMLTMLGEWILT
jgi:hypothetical protein